MYFKTKPKQMYNTQQVLEASVMAQRINGEYLKEKETKYTEVDGVTEYVVTKLDNKSIVYAYLLGKGRDEKDNKFIDTLTLEVTEADKQEVKDIHDHYEGKLFSAMGGQLDSYTENIWKVLDKEEVSALEVGLIASTPSAYERDIAKEGVEDKITSVCVDEYIGSKGDKIEGSVEIVNAIFSKNYNAFIYTGIYEGKFLVNFWNNEELAKQGDTIKIKARIKRLAESKFYNKVWETQLNYVKKII